VKNRISYALMKALADDFERHGVEAVKLCRGRDPIAYLKIIAGLMPKELEFTDNRLADLSDDELDAFLELARQRVAERAGNPGRTDDREDKTLN
jgi:hypothetical protein